MTGTIIAVSCFIGAIIWGILAGRKRRGSRAQLAKELGLTFSDDRDYHLPDEYPALAGYQGANRFACNIFTGKYKNTELTAFDLIYDTDDGRKTACFICRADDKKTLLFTADNAIEKEDLKARLDQISEPS